MKQLICKECGSERKVGRRLCSKCNSKRMSLYPRYLWDKTCSACKLEFKALRKHQVLCKDCYIRSQELASRDKVDISKLYIKDAKSSTNFHRTFAQKTIGRILDSKEVVHHIDGDPRNNDVTNLIVLTARIHAKLHGFLNVQRVILEKSNTENFENCWKTLIGPMTTAWLETESATVIKLWEIGQSAAEPLNNNIQKLHEEGSETMHEIPDHSVEGNDIVQTTTTQFSRQAKV